MKNPQALKTGGFSYGHPIKSQLNDLLGGHKVLRPDSDKIDSFLEVGEVELVGSSFHFFV